MYLKFWLITRILAKLISWLIIRRLIILIYWENQTTVVFATTRFNEKNTPAHFLGRSPEHEET